MTFVGQWQPLKDIPPTDVPIVFTAGPIQTAPDWQSDVAALFKEYGTRHIGLPDFAMANPRAPEPYHGDYEGQVRWELNHLERAGMNGVVMFWLAKPDPNGVHPEGRAYAQTSRFELGEWVGRQVRTCNIPYGPSNLVVGIEPGFSNERYLRFRLNWAWPMMQVRDTIEATIEEVFLKLRGLGSHV